MGIEENKEVVRRFSERGASGDISVIDELTTSDFVFHVLGLTSPIDINREDVKHSLDSSTYSYTAITVEEVVAEGDKVMQLSTVSIQHEGGDKLFNFKIAETKTVTFPRCSIFRIEDGKIAEMWNLDNWLSQLQQIGALPPTEEIVK